MPLRSETVVFWVSSWKLAGHFSKKHLNNRCSKGVLFVQTLTFRSKQWNEPDLFFLVSETNEHPTFKRHDSARHDEFEPTRWCAFRVPWDQQFLRSETRGFWMFETERSETPEVRTFVQFFGRGTEEGADDRSSQLFFWSWFWSMNNYDNICLQVDIQKLLSYFFCT